MAERHPGLTFALNALRDGRAVTPEDVDRLERQLRDLELRASASAPESAPPAALPEPPSGDTLPGWATAEGTARFSVEVDRAAASFYRQAQGLVLSSVGIGTYYGTSGAGRDVTDAVHAALGRGINVVDTSLNYGHQSSERRVATALRRHVAAGGRRDEVLVCTKGGFLVPGAVTPGTVTPADVVSGHAIAPAFLRDQLQRSRDNLGVETIDVYYVHNPEIQLATVGAAEFEARMGRAFEALEATAELGYIRHYGIATWHGFRDGSLSLRALVTLAREVGGDRHRFRFVQFPVNLGLGVPGHDLLAQASDLGVTAIASASLMQGRLARDLPGMGDDLAPGAGSDAQRALQFARSTPGITTALVGMRRLTHVAENARLAEIPPMDATDHARWAALLG